MGLFNKNKAPEQKVLTPDQKAKKLLEALSKYIQENSDTLEDDREKMQRLRDISAELEQDNLTEERVEELKQELENEGIEANFDISDEKLEDEDKTKKSNKKVAGYILAALLAIGIGGGAYIYSNSEKDDEKEKTEQVDGKKESKDEKKGGGKAPSKTDGSYQDHVKKLEEVSKRNATIQESVNNAK